MPSPEYRPPATNRGPMSDDVLSIIPTDPNWQPTSESADRATALAADLAPGAPDGVDVEIEVSWNERPALVDCGANLEKTTCPRCNASIATAWWAQAVGTTH